MRYPIILEHVPRQQLYTRPSFIQWDDVSDPAVVSFFAVGYCTLCSSLQPLVPAGEN